MQLYDIIQRDPLPSFPQWQHLENHSLLSQPGCGYSQVTEHSHPHKYLSSSPTLGASWFSACWLRSPVGQALLESWGDRAAKRDKPTLLGLSFRDTDMNKETHAEIIGWQLISAMKKNQEAVDWERGGNPEFQLPVRIQSPAHMGREPQSSCLLLTG